MQEGEVKAFQQTTCGHSAEVKPEVGFISYNLAVDLKKGIEKIIVHKVSLLTLLWNDRITFFAKGNLLVAIWGDGFHSLISNEGSILPFEFVFKWSLCGCSTEVVNNAIVLHGSLDTLSNFFSGLSFGYE
jgi:hypothetical protein